MDRENDLNKNFENFSTIKGGKSHYMVKRTCLWLIEIVKAFRSSHLIASVFLVNQNDQLLVEIEDAGESFGCMRREKGMKLSE